VNLKIVVAGCRYYNDYHESANKLDDIITAIPKDEKITFISGKCRGADRIGEEYARKNGYEIEYFSADWKRYGRAAGPIRNKEMVKSADLIVCFWDEESRGTKSLIEICRKLNKKTVIIRIKN